MSFAGFGTQALPFFKALAFHQTKAWFDENRALYESDVKTPLGDLVEDLALAFEAAAIPFRGDRKASIFRINRDVRFSNDKSPYKTHAGAVMTRDGRKGAVGLFYIHIDPEGCFLAAGWHHPPAATLATLRAAIAKEPAAFRALEKGLSKKGLAFSDSGALKRNPRGYEAVEEADTKAALRRVSLVVSRPLDETRLYGPGLVGDAVAFAKDVMPLMNFGWKVAD